MRGRTGARGMPTPWGPYSVPLQPRTTARPHIQRASAIADCGSVVNGSGGDGSGGDGSGGDGSADDEQEGESESETEEDD